ncbi:MAG: DUF2520 domain-containing protein [Gammaproteobacteria bacterium]|nr:MAG: DUF2520 domain-containing protein [Gammaproteobacteria bacterium]
MESSPTPPKLTLVGAGRLGRTLARLWADSGVFTIGEVITRHPASALDAVNFIGQGTPRSIPESSLRADVLLLAVPDDQLAAVATSLTDQIDIAPGSIAFHCSGALDAACLAPLRDKGAAVASAHPMHSFADPHASLETFTGTFCALEGDATALAQLEPAFATIGGRPLRIAAEAKLLYHAGGVFAANYVTALLATATRLVEAAGVSSDEARALLAPLLRGAVESGLKLGPGAALTGPIARGDSDLVARQAKAVTDHDAELGTLYRALGHATLKLACERDELDQAQLSAIAKALSVPE